MIFLSLLFVLSGWDACAALDASSFRLPLPEVEKLPNGLTVAWFVDERLPVIDLALMVQSGTRNDPKGKGGIAELTTRMLERGAHGISAADFSHQIESLGATGFASADEESITIGMHGLSQDAEKFLRFVAWMAREPNFLVPEFERERARLTESWRHLTDSAESVSGYVFGKAILNGSIYGRGSLESIQSLSALRIADARAFHRENFVPSNSILVVVGRVDRKAFRNQILALFANWQGGAPKRVSSVVNNPKFTVRTGEVLIVDMPGLPQAQIRLGFLSPGIQSPKRHALAVATALLGEYFGSRLNLIVRDRLGLAYGIQSSLTYFKEKAFFSIASATAAPNTGKLLSETIHQLRLLKAADVLNEEIEVAKGYLIGSYPLNLSTLSAVATRWMNGYTFQLGPDYVNEFIPKVAAVTRESVVQAVDEAFQLDRLVIVVAGDAKAIEKSLRDNGFKRFRKIPVKSLL